MNILEAVEVAKHLAALDGATFYRSLYEVKAGESLQLNQSSWAQLPFLTKDHLLAAPLDERILSLTETDHLRASSGTSGKPPLFSPRTFLRGMEYRLEYHDFKKPILAFGVPAAVYWHEWFQKNNGGSGSAIAYDPSEPSASVRLAHHAGADSISTFAFHLTTIGEHMRAEGMNDNIRFIEICGEACTSQLYSFLRTTFPHATVIPFYGSSEVEDSPIGFPCHAIDGSEPLAVYHAKASQYHELIDPRDGTLFMPAKGAEGELVVTAYPGPHAAFPLVRYRTGDVVRVVDAHCEKHASWSFTVVGRAQLDFVKVPGGMIRVDEMARVISRIRDLTGEFEIHVFEEDQDGAPVIRLEVHVEAKTTVDYEEIARRIANEFRINPTLSYAEGVANGRFMALSCAPLVPKSGKKKRLVRH